MRKLLAVATVLLVCGAALAAAAGDQVEAAGRTTTVEKEAKVEQSSSADESLLERDRLTGNWAGGRDALEDIGITLDFGLTQIWQHNVHGGLRTHGRRGDYSGSYDLELTFDLERLFGLTGGSVYSLVEGSWPRAEGVGDISVGSVFGVNDDAGGNRAVDVTEFWYEQALFGCMLRFRVGKIDLTGGFECRGCPVAFDGNSYANDETAQFLNAALVNNPTIPFPDNGLGLVAYFQPTDWFYVAAGVADEQADAREMGFATAVVPEFPGPKKPLVGTYRLGMWYDPQPKERLGGSGSMCDDVGFYASFDQAVYCENDDEDDSQGLGVFLRFGHADARLNEARMFWSVGLQYQGPIPSRDDDVLGFGYAYGRLSPDAGFTTATESVFELYYNAQVTRWLSVTPDIQIVVNPGGDTELHDSAVVLGCRVQMAF